MTAWLRMIGITDITHIEFEKTLMGPEVDHAERTRASAEAVRLGATI